jgi:biotin carboxyl carrier protein
MEHVVAAPAAGRIARIAIAVDDQVVRGQTLATVEDEVEDKREP